MSQTQKENAPLAGGAKSACDTGVCKSHHTTPAPVHATAELSVGPWGAAAGDWDHFDRVCELTADLLPVVSNPNAKKSPTSKIAGPGKTPSRYNGRGEMAGFPAWTQHRATGSDIAKWSTQPDYGICIQTRRIRAIDVDVEDFDEAAEVEAFILSHLGYTLPTRRRSNSSKFAMLFELQGDLTKRRFKTKSAGGVIELLATGQQIVVAGTHPKGARYVFDGGLPAVIPALTAEGLETLWAALNERFGIEDSVEVAKGIAPAKKRLAADTKDATVNFLVENWTVYDIDRSGRVDIECPFKDEHTSDSGESATSYFPAGVGGFEQGHFKCQHSHCAHRSDGEFSDAIGIGAADFDVIPDAPAAPPPLPAFTRAEGGRDRGKIEPTRNNLAVALARPDICGHQLRFDTFLDDLMIAEGANGKEWREFKDEDYFALALRLEAGASSFKHIPTETIRDAVKFTAKNNQFDTAKDWLAGLKWDGTHRVETFLSRYVGAEEGPYARAVSLYFWSALAGRVIEPGVKADMTPVAVGHQGAKKTSLVQALVPETRFVGELDLSDDRKETARAMRGKLIMELGELSGLSKRSMGELKAFLSRQSEAWTPKYVEFATVAPRRCMFFGTTNDDEILVDDTGNRRWLPFRSSGADPVGLAAVRDQMWAEGAHLFKTHGVMWEAAERLAKDVHEDFTVTDPWDSAVNAWLFADEVFTDERGNTGRPADRAVENSEVLSGALGIPVDRQTHAIETRMGRILKRFGFEHVRQRIPKGEQSDSGRDRRWVYVRVPPVKGKLAD